MIDKRTVLTGQGYIDRSELRANPDKAYLFGDNLIQRGLGGQAKEMRGEPNAFGIPTKKMPSMNEGSFMTDNEAKKQKAFMEYLERYRQYEQAHTKDDEPPESPFDAGWNAGEAAAEKQWVAVEKLVGMVRYHASTHNLSSQENPCECDMCMIFEALREFDEREDKENGAIDR